MSHKGNQDLKDNLLENEKLTIKSFHIIYMILWLHKNIQTEFPFLVELSFDDYGVHQLAGYPRKKKKILNEEALSHTSIIVLVHLIYCHFLLYFDKIS